jgi:hypothetical protein
MATKKIIIILFCALSITSCTQKTNNNDDIEIIEEASYESSEDYELYLNEGRKWPVHSHMHQVFKEMQKVVENNSENLAFDVILERKNMLNLSIQKLVSNCTMEGEAHDQLHHLLIPFIEAVENISEDDSLSAEKSYTQAFFLLQEYDVYFEEEE